MHVQSIVLNHRSCPSAERVDDDANQIREIESRKKGPQSREVESGAVTAAAQAPSFGSPNCNDTLQSTYICTRVVHVTPEVESGNVHKNVGTCSTNKFSPTGRAAKRQKYTPAT